MSLDSGLTSESKGPDSSAESFFNAIDAKLRSYGIVVAQCTTWALNFPNYTSRIVDDRLRPGSNDFIGPLYVPQPAQVAQPQKSYARQLYEDIMNADYMTEKKPLRELAPVIKFSDADKPAA